MSTSVEKPEAMSSAQDYYGSPDTAALNLKNQFDHALSNTRSLAPETPKTSLMDVILKNSGGEVQSDEAIKSMLAAAGNAVTSLEGGTAITTTISEHLLSSLYPDAKPELLRSTPLTDRGPGNFSENVYLINGKELKLEISSTGQGSQNKVQLELEDGSKIAMKYDSYHGVVSLQSVVNPHLNDAGETVYDFAETAVNREGITVHTEGESTINSNNNSISTRINLSDGPPDMLQNDLMGGGRIIKINDQAELVTTDRHDRLIAHGETYADASLAASGYDGAMEKATHQYFWSDDNWRNEPEPFVDYSTRSDLVRQTAVEDLSDGDKVTIQTVTNVRNEIRQDHLDMLQAFQSSWQSW